MCTFEVFSNAEGGDVRKILFRVINPNIQSSGSTSTTLSLRALFLSREELRKTFTSREKKEKRREALITPLPLSRLWISVIEFLSHSLCLSVCRLGEREREKERNF